MLPLNAAEALESSSILLQRRRAKAAQLTCSSAVAQPDQRCGSQWASGPNFPKSHNHDDHTNKWCCLYVYYYVVECFFLFFLNRLFSFLGLIIKNVFIRNLAGWSRRGLFQPLAVTCWVSCISLARHFLSIIIRKWQASMTSSIAPDSQLCINWQLGPSGHDDRRNWSTASNKLKTRPQTHFYNTFKSVLVQKKVKQVFCFVLFFSPERLWLWEGMCVFNKCQV